MSVATLARAGSFVVRAPCAGRVRLHPPKGLCGDLEVFDAGDPIASIDVVPVQRIDAPALGFVLRLLVEDGATVSAGTPILELRLA